MLKLVASSVLAVAALVAVGCDSKEEPVETFESLLEAGKADGGPAWLLGTLSYGQSSGPVVYKAPPRFRGYAFEGAAGDVVSLDVRSRKGDAVAWLVDADGHVLASNDDAGPSTLDAHVDATLEHAGAHYIVFRDYYLRRATFTVTLDGTPAGPPPPMPVAIDPALLAGTWEGESFADSGHPPEPAPPGQYYRFGADGSIAFGCGTESAGTWAIDPNGYTLNVTLGDGSVSLQWFVIGLDASKLSFVEGGDIFNYKRSSCP